MNSLELETLHLALVEGRQKHASDTHLRGGTFARHRIDGELVERREFPISQAAIEAFSDQAFGRAPEIAAAIARDGHASIGFETEKFGRIRVTAFSADGKRRLRIRFITPIEELEDLKGHPSMPPKLRDLAMINDGSILVAARNGQGKSTLLDQIVHYRRRERAGESIITLDNPRERTHALLPGCADVEQREYGVDFSDWETAINGSLEQNPDAMVVGQAIGADAIASVTTLANTGVAVFGTIHVRDTTQVFARILDATPAHRATEVRANLLESGRAFIGIRLVPKREGVPGLKRIAVIEILVLNSDVRNLLRSTTATQSLLDTMESRVDGMQTFEWHLSQLANADIITHDVARAYAQRPERLRLKAPARVSVGA